MKVILLAGGLGTRIMEESEQKPKPMVEVGGMPILWHIMKAYSYFGYTEFIICAGYRHYMIKKWFADYQYYTSDVTFDFTNNGEMSVISEKNEPWKITVIDTGLRTNTGGRIKRVQSYIGDEEFMVTYGDGVCDVDIADLAEFHRTHGKIGTLTTVEERQTKGVLNVELDNTVSSFREKQNMGNTLINAGYMVFEPEIFDYLSDNAVLEKEVLTRLADEGELMSYHHEGFWQCMDNLKEKQLIEHLIEEGRAPWMRW